MKQKKNNCGYKSLQCGVEEKKRRLGGEGMKRGEELQERYSLVFEKNCTNIN